MNTDNLTNLQAFARKEQVALTVALLYEKIKKWGATPFDAFEKTVSVTIPRDAGATPVGSTDTIIFAENKNRFLLKRVNGMEFAYYEIWSTVDLYMTSSSLRTDRLFICPTGYIINGIKFEPDTSNIEASITALQNLVSGEGGLSSRMTAVEGKASTNETNISNLTTRVGEHDTNISEINTKLGGKVNQTAFDNLKAIVDECGATYVDGIVTGAIQYESSSATQSADDKIVYSVVNNRFYLLREEGSGAFNRGTYYENWDKKTTYNSASTGKVRSDRFFVSPQGYIIKGKPFYVNHEEIESKISSLESAISNLDDNKANKEDLEALADKLGASILSFGGFVDKIIAPLSGSAGDVNSKFIFFNKKDGLFYAMSSNKYYEEWDGSDKYRDASRSSKPHEDTLYASKNGYIVLGEVFEADLDEVYAYIDEGLAGKADESSVASRLAQKLDINTFNAEKQTLNNAIQQKANSTTVDQLAQVVAGKANQTDVSNLAYAVTQRVERSLYDNSMEVISKSLNDINDRLGQNLHKVFVDELPTENPDPYAIYFLRLYDEAGEEYFDQYVWNTEEERYERTGTSKMEIDGLTTLGENNRSIAATTGVPYTITDGYVNVPIVLKGGEKWKIELETEAFLSSLNYYYDQKSPDVQMVPSPITPGEVKELSAIESHTSILFTANADVTIRLYLVDNALGYNVMTDDDVYEIFNNLE